MRIVAQMIILIMMTSTLAGCTGDLENEIDELENQIQDNQSEISDLNSTIDGLQRNVEELNVTIVERESQITDLLSQITEYQLSITSLNNQNDTNIELINQLTINITSLELTITELGVQIVALQDAKTSLEVQIGILESAKSTLEEQVSSLSSTNQDLILENENSAIEISELQAYASTLNATISELLNTISEMEDESESENWSSTLDTILDRGNMKCGVKGGQYGMAYSDPDTSERSGLDISYCRAIAAAIGLDPENDIEYIESSGSDRFERLANGSIDVLIRTTTWTTSRDADLDANFGAINFYDGQGILINTDEFPDATSALDLDGASICVAIGSTSAGNIEDYFEENNMS